MDLTCQAALNSPGNASNETLQWAQAFQSESSIESLSRHYQPRKSHADSSVDMRPALCSRSKIDPDAWAFQYRLQQNDLRPKDVDFQATHQAQSQLYFQQLVECMGVRSAPLSDVRAFEARQWETVEFTWSQAIECVGHCFHEVDASFRQRLSDLLSQGQVRVTQDAYQPDLCLDTAFGSFVQLHFDGSLGSVVRLAHELGHAIHQSMYRDHPSQQTPPAPLEQEIWAMTFERCLLQTLCADFPDWIRQLNAFRQSQWIEMNHRHRMLTAFEQALHRPEVQCDTAVNQLWLEYNQGFYGSRITLDPSFRTAWQDIHHFWQAPFYLAIYPNAIERAAQSDLRQMIHPYRQ
jgi:oligoendopeptidase F